MQEQITLSGRFPTTHGAKYLAQLCKHFGHKVPAEVEPGGGQGRVSFAVGEVRLQANAAVLHVTLAGADQAAMDELRQVIDAHLQRFAFREGFAAMDWGVPA